MVVIASYDVVCGDIDGCGNIDDLTSTHSFTGMKNRGVYLMHASTIGGIHWTTLLQTNHNK